MSQATYYAPISSIEKCPIVYQYKSSILRTLEFLSISIISPQII